MLLEPVPLTCPYCGAGIETQVDVSAGDQAYIEDCPVCCAPMELAVQIDEQGLPTVTVRRDDA